MTIQLFFDAFHISVSIIYISQNFIDNWFYHIAISIGCLYKRSKGDEGMAFVIKYGNKSSDHCSLWEIINNLINVTSEIRCRLSLWALLLKLLWWECRRTPLMISQYIWQHVITWTNTDPNLCNHMASLGNNELRLATIDIETNSKLLDSPHKGQEMWSFNICLLISRTNCSTYSTHVGNSRRHAENISRLLDFSIYIVFDCAHYDHMNVDTD